MRARMVGLVMAGWAALITSPAAAEEASPGRAAYLRYCSACHGSEGKGDGVVSGLMQPRPTDLTTLARNNDGKFPTVRVRDAIDGRKNVAAHGSSDMPVWGEVFSERKPAAHGEAHVRAEVQQITDYLATIQEK